MQDVTLTEDVLKENNFDVTDFLEDTMIYVGVFNVTTLKVTKGFVEKWKKFSSSSLDALNVDQLKLPNDLVPPKKDDRLPTKISKFSNIFFN